MMLADRRLISGIKRWLISWIIVAKHSQNKIRDVECGRFEHHIIIRRNVRPLASSAGCTPPRLRAHSLGSVSPARATTTTHELVFNLPCPMRARTPTRRARRPETPTMRSGSACNPNNAKRARVKSRQYEAGAARCFTHAHNVECAKMR